jgi:hypothetical protein
MRKLILFLCIATCFATPACRRSHGASANMFCQFTQADTRQWSATANADRSVTVKGQAHVDDSKYLAKLWHPEVQGSTARAFVTEAENKTGQIQPGGWWDVSYTFPDPSVNIQTVEIWCDLSTRFARIPVRRG